MDLRSVDKAPFTTSIQHSVNITGQFITMVTALSVGAATLAPRLLGPLAVSAQGLAQVWVAKQCGLEIMLGWG